MIIYGYTENPNQHAAESALSRLGDSTLVIARRVIQNVMYGIPQTIPDDKLLREELSECNFIIK